MLMVTDGYQVNHDASNMRSNFKVIARTLVASLYSIFPANRSYDASTNELSQAYTAQAVDDLLNGNELWMNGVDPDTVRSHPSHCNFTHILGFRVLCFPSSIERYKN